MASPRKTDIAQAVLKLADTTPEDILAKTVAAYLISERRSGEIEAIMREVERLRAQKSGITEATVTAARPLSSTTKKHIKEVLGTDNIQLNEVIDKSVIGGVRIETSDVHLDLTVRGRLQRLKRKQGVYA